ncbi:MAG: aminotransferase class V-fold PLP-dependent enzyme [Planctomycetota bacterium]
MRRVYFDNAATSFPKPPEVLRAMTDYATRLGASPGRGAYAEAREAGALMHRCRERISRLIGGESPEHVVFTLNTSDALNLAIRGLARPGDHIVTTEMDHNSVLRPLNALIERSGITQTRVPVDPETGVVNPDDVRSAIRRDTRLVAVVHASNVTGSLQPVGEIGRICRDIGVPLLVDAAQSVGHMPLDVQELAIDLLAVPGHKGLLGPLGTGALYIRPGLERSMQTVREGGTGSVSELDVQPETMPDRFEPGSHNAIGIIGLSEGVQYLLERGIDAIAEHERGLTSQFIEGLHTGGGEHHAEMLPGLRLLGPQGVAQRTGVFAVTVDGLPPGALSDLLEERYGVLTRSGLHCAPLAHRTFGCAPEQVASPEFVGATRFSIGPFLTLQDVKFATDALAEICEQHAAGRLTAGVA